MRLKFELSEIQKQVVSETLTKLENAHRAKQAWFDDYDFSGSSLSIHPYDLFTVLDHCERCSENEMELFRLKKSAVEQMTSRLAKPKSDIEKRNIEMWLDSYKKLWLGQSAGADLMTAPHQPERIELIP